MQLISSDEKLGDLSEFEQAVQKLEKMQTLPAVVHRLIQVTADPDCSMDDVEGLIASDQGLAARVMRIASSPAYSPRPANNLRAALMRIGLRDLRQMAVAAAVTSGKSSAFHTELWSYSLLTATVANKLGKALPSLGVKDPFLCGLLHDFGTLVMAQVRGKEYEALVGKPGRGDQCELERDALGFDHTDIGTMVATQWQLAEEFEYVMQFHHAPFDVEYLALEPEVENAVLLVALAREVALAHLATGEDGASAEVLELSDLALQLAERMKLPEDKMGSAVAKALERFEKLKSTVLG